MRIRVLNAAGYRFPFVISSEYVAHELGIGSHSNAIVVNAIAFSHFVRFTFTQR